MLELLAAYLVLGGLTALARGRWRVADIARTTVVWPVMLPELLRGDPSPQDPPALPGWVARIDAALGSLQSAIDEGKLLANEDAGRKLLTDTRSDLLDVARRHAELDAVLQEETYDLTVARQDLAQGQGQGQGQHNTALSQRVATLEKLHRARAALEFKLEEGMAEVMDLAARLHLARATGAPVQSVAERIRGLADAVGAATEAEELGGIDLDEVLPGTWAPAQPAPQPAPQTQPVADDPPARPVAEPVSTEEREAFEQVFTQGSPNLPMRMDPVSPDERTDQADPAADAWNARITMAGVVGALGLLSIAYRVLGIAGLEQTAALFIGLPTLLAMVVALLPAGRSFTGLALKVTTLLLLLSCIVLMEGFICIVMAAPIFYTVALLAGFLLDMLRSQSRRHKVAALMPFMLLSLEGVHPALSLPRDDSAAVSRHVAAAPAEVAAALAVAPDFSAALPRLMQLGFPRPVRSLGAGLAVGDRRVVHLAGGEGQPGDLVLEVAEVTNSSVRFVAVSDDSHVAHWLSWQEAEVTWAPEGEGSRVSWILRYERELDPALWFGPVERHVVGLTAGYLLDSHGLIAASADPEVSHASR